MTMELDVEKLYVSSQYVLKMYYKSLL